MKRILFWLGPIVFLVSWNTTLAGLSHEGLVCAGLALWMALWWTSESIPIAGTSLLPLVIFPMTGVMTTQETAQVYAHHLILLFMSGFFIAAAMKRWGLHKRIALSTIQLVGTEPAKMILGFMVATGCLSMWISNTATTMMMVPIAMSILALPSLEMEPELRRTFGTALMLAIAYAASIGGVATLIGTPPNAIMAAHLENRYQIHLGFAKWMAIGIPLASVMIAVCWILLTKIMFPIRGRILDGKEIIDQYLSELGPISRNEVMILGVIALVGLGWTLRGFFPEFLPSVSDASIGMTGVVVLFCLPSAGNRQIRLLDWESAARIPWEVVLLFGGGLALAGGFTHSGLAGFVGEWLASLSQTSFWLFILTITGVVIFLTEITSNTASATILIPIVGAAAAGLGYGVQAPIMTAAVSASFAFMLPVATPPNAIVYASQILHPRDMARAGFILNLISIAVITAVFSVFS